jgi:crotonobetainyl-CoA:carnitine CoA-transferase CaiB-like acyl-CoA transferase
MTRPAAHPVMGTINLLRSPINLSACPHPDAFQSAAPDPGQHTDALLNELGFDAAAIQTMKDEGAVV